MYNKNTVKLSRVDDIIKVLNKTRQDYSLTILGKIISKGLNDNGKEHEMRRLEYGSVIVMEQIIKTKDKDSNDMIVSVEFDRGVEPKEWKLEVDLQN